MAGAFAVPAYIGFDFYSQVLILFIILISLAIFCWPWLSMDSGYEVSIMLVCLCVILEMSWMRRIQIC